MIFLFSFNPHYTRLQKSTEYIFIKLTIGLIRYALVGKSNINLKWKLWSMKVAKLWNQLSTFFATPYFRITSKMIIFDHFCYKLISTFMCYIFLNPIFLKSTINIQLSANLSKTTNVTMATPKSTPC